jgi:ribonuclease-3
MAYDKLFKTIGYKFNDINLLQESLTHPSISFHNHTRDINYERLEFLGDAVLSFVVTEFLITEHASEKEGSLAKRRSALVCKDTLADLAYDMHLGEYILMTEGEEQTGGRNNCSNLENTLEALIGAIYLDGGITPTKKFIHQFWLPLDKQMISAPKDPKTSLQEWSQKSGRKIPKYTIIDSEGPSHSPIFTVEVKLDEKLKASATANSKKLAERMAAEILLQQIKESNE